MDTIRQELQQFANKHKIVFEDKGEVGFGRPCVGFLYGDSYIDINPFHSRTYEPIWEEDTRLLAPNGVDSYHKHDCLCVLVHNNDYDTSLKQLLVWVKHLEAQGEVEVVDYPTGATGMQALLTGIIGHAIRFKGGA